MPILTLSAQARRARPSPVTAVIAPAPSPVRVGQPVRQCEQGCAR